MDFMRLLQGIDNLIFSRPLPPEDLDRLYQFRGAIELEMERQKKAMAFNALRGAFQRNLEMQTPGLFMGEQLTGGLRNVPGGEGHGIFIQPKEVPSGHIRSFVPNTSRYGDQGMNIELRRQGGFLGI